MSGKLINFETAIAAGNGGAQIKKALNKILTEKHDPKDFLGWLNLPEDKTSVREVNAWLKKVKKNQTTLCVLGIGGSCLGAKAIYDFVLPEKPVLFFDNVDGYSFERQLKGLSFKNCHFLAISKSGETSETLFQLAHVFQMLDQKKLKPKDHITVVTEDKASSLRTIAEEYALPTMTVPFDVGGRFSVFSSVGLAPLAWAGVSVGKMLAGAGWVKGQEQLLCDMTAYYLNGFSRSEWISIFWSYVDGLKTFGLWLEQLWAESLGKAKDRIGQAAPRTTTPITCIGATDQHSLLQQFTEGARDKHFLFIRSTQSEKSQKIKKLYSPKLTLTKGRSVGELLAIEAGATQKILDNLKIATARLTIEKQDAASIGALIFLFEMVVATLGECLNINAFDQPGVEAVKKVTLGTLGDPRYKDQALNNS